MGNLIDAAPSHLCEQMFYQILPVNFVDIQNPQREYCKTKLEHYLHDVPMWGKETAV